MAVDVTIIVESNDVAGGSHSMKRTVHRGSSNDRYYPSEIEHAIVELATWASNSMTNLVGKDKLLRAKGATMVVAQDEQHKTMDAAQKFHDINNGRSDRVLIGRDALEELYRHSSELKAMQAVQNTCTLVDNTVLAELRSEVALLNAMRAAGVDNWQGMDNVDRPSV